MSLTSTMLSGLFELLLLCSLLAVLADKVPTVVICAIAKNEEKYIDEWITYHRYLGFDFIHLFDNSDDNVLGPLMEKYEGFLIVHHSPGIVMQLHVYDAFATALNWAKFWVAVIDIDEFIVLRKHKSIKTVIENYGGRGSLCLNWIMFGSNGHKNYTDVPVLERFTLRGKRVNEHVKCISFMQDVEHIHSPHHPVLYGNESFHDTNFNYFHGPYNENGTEDVAVVHHYFTKSYEEFEWKVRRGKGDMAYWGRNGEILAVVGRNLTEFEQHDANEVRDTSALDAYVEYRPIYDRSFRNEFSLFYDLVDHVDTLPGTVFEIAKPPPVAAAGELVSVEDVQWQQVLNTNLIEVPVRALFVGKNVHSLHLFNVTLLDVLTVNELEMKLVAFCVDRQIATENCLVLSEVVAERLRNVTLDHPQLHDAVHRWRWNASHLEALFHYFDGAEYMLTEAEAHRLDMQRQDSLHPRSACYSSWNQLTNRPATDASQQQAGRYVNLSMLVIYHEDKGDLVYENVSRQAQLIVPLQIRSSIFFEYVAYRDYLPYGLRAHGLAQFAYVGITTYKTVNRYPGFCGHEVERLYRLGLARDYDVLPLIRSKKRLMLTATFQHSRKFKVAWDLLLQAMGFDLSTIRKFDMIHSFYRNSMLIKPHWLRRLSSFMSEAMEHALQNDTVYAALSQPAHYEDVGEEAVSMSVFQSKLYQLFPFVLERLPSFYLHYQGAHICHDGQDCGFNVEW